MNEEIIDFCAESEIICPSFHIALQSGDDYILRKMKRRYKPKDFIKCTDYIRHKIPHASIGTDIMVGAKVWFAQANPVQELAHSRGYLQPARSFRISNSAHFTIYVVTLLHAVCFNVV